MLAPEHQLAAVAAAAPPVAITPMDTATAGVTAATNIAIVAGAALQVAAWFEEICRLTNTLLTLSMTLMTLIASVYIGRWLSNLVEFGGAGVILGKLTFRAESGNKCIYCNKYTFKMR